MDDREDRLRRIGQRIAAARALEAERDNLLRDLAANGRKRTLSELAELAGLTKGRVHQIIAKANRGG